MCPRQCQHLPPAQQQLRLQAAGAPGIIDALYSLAEVPSPFCLLEELLLGRVSHKSLGPGQQVPVMLFPGSSLVAAEAGPDP